jgi:ribonucleotide reductase alpha subunit
MYRVVMKHAPLIDATIDYSRDFEFDYFGFKTLERSYLLRLGQKVVERPQHMVSPAPTSHSLSPP